MSTNVETPGDLIALVGETLGTTAWFDVTQAEVNMFADATGDHQWIHTDPERAKDGPFGRTIAHGYLTLALAPRILEQVVTVAKMNAALNYGLNKVRFPTPVPVGSKVRATVSLVSAVKKPAGLEVVYGLTYEVDGAARPACVADVVVLYL